MQILVLQVSISIGSGRVPVPPYTYPSMATATDVVFICGELVRSLLALFRDITLDQRQFSSFSLSSYDIPCFGYALAGNLA